LQKKNFHLVKLLEPIFIVGSRIEDIKGYYFTLLGPDESSKVTPVLEELMLKRANENKYKPPPKAVKRGGEPESKAPTSR
jgi:S-ribosylhomocysteine lyase LuxS involved in autoinducer biosynthesis